MEKRIKVVVNPLKRDVSSLDQWKVTYKETIKEQLENRYKVKD